MTTSAGFWRGRSVLVTGHTGFKGSWLSLWLASWGAEVHGYSLEPPTTPSLYEVGRVSNHVASDTRADVSDLQSLRACMEQCRPEVVFHLAAQPLVIEGYRDPVRTFQTNVAGTVNLLEAVRDASSVRVVVVVTTDKVYENREWSYPYREIDPLGGGDPYSASKAAAELVTAAYRTSFLNDRKPSPVRLATARAGNVIGGGDWGADRLVPDCIRAFISGQPVSLKHPGSVRPWQHVLDCLYGYLRLADCLIEGEPERFARSWNFSPPGADDATVGEVAEVCARSWGGGASVGLASPAVAVREAGLLRLDSSEARCFLGWTPRWALHQAIDRTVEWYRRWVGGDDMEAFSREQIRSYEESHA